MSEGDIIRIKWRNPVLNSRTGQQAHGYAVRVYSGFAIMVMLKASRSVYLL